MSVSDGHYVALEADIRDLKNSLAEARNLMERQTQGMQTRLDGFTRGMRSIATTLAGVFAVGFLSTLTLGLLEAGSAAAETQAKFRAVFKELADDTDRWATETATAFGRAKTEIREFLAGVQDTFVPLGFARRQAAEVSKGLTQLALDLGAFYNQAEKDVIAKLTSALVGNHEAVRSYGVIITEATLKQELLNLGFTRGIQNATEQHKALARLSIILKSTSDAQGSAAREVNGYAAQVKMLQSQWTSFKEYMGQAIIPLATMIIQATKWMAEGIADFAGKIRDVAMPILTAFGRTVTYVAGDTVKAAAKLGMSIKETADKGLVDLAAKAKALEEASRNLGAGVSAGAGVAKFAIAGLTGEQGKTKTAAERTAEAYAKLREEMKAMFAGIKPNAATTALTAQERMIERLRRRMTDPDSWRVKVWISPYGKEHLTDIKTKLETLKKIGDVFGSSFEDAVMKATSGAKVNFKEMAVSMLQDLQRVLMRALIIQPILQSLGLGTSPGVAAVSNNNTGLFDGLLAALPKFHNGLKPTEFPAILEQGEAVLAKNEVRRLAELAGTPAGTMVGGGGTTVVNNYYTIDARNGDAGTAERTLNAMKTLEQERPGARQALDQYNARFPTR